MEWIKCSDRLPYEDDRDKRFMIVLSYPMDRPILNDKYFHYWIATALYLGNREWRIDLNEVNNVWKDSIIYWSEMPDLPKELIK